MSALDDQLENFAEYLGMGIVALLLALFALISYKKQRSRALLYFSISWLSFFIFSVLDSVISILPSVFWFQFSYAFIIPLNPVFLLAFIDETMNEHLGLKKMVIAFSAWAMLATFMFSINWEWSGSDYITVNPSMYIWYIEISNVDLSLVSIGFGYWAIKTYLGAPSILRPLTNKLFILGIAALISIPLEISANSTLLAIQSILAIVIAFGTILIIRKEPRIIHILPYKVYKLIIASRAGEVFYAKEWANMKPRKKVLLIKEKEEEPQKEGVASILDNQFLSSFMTAIRDAFTHSRSTGNVDLGALESLNLSYAKMLLEMRHLPISIILLASRVSLSLKKSLSDFSDEFMKIYNDCFYGDDDLPCNKLIDIADKFSEVKMKPLLEKYFWNIPIFE